MRKLVSDNVVARDTADELLLLLLQLLLAYFAYLAAT